MACAAAHRQPSRAQSAAGYLGWKQALPGGAAMKELAQFLLDRAMEHDSPTLLFNLAAEYLISARAGGRPVARADRDAAATGGCGGRMEAASA